MEMGGERGLKFMQLFTVLRSINIQSIVKDTFYRPFKFVALYIEALQHKSYNVKKG
jgi:hypothetical protein